MIFSLVATPVFASSVKEVKAELPVITAKVKAPAGTFENLDKSAIKATLDGVELSTDDAKLENSSTEWIIMLDTSLSLSADHFTAEKSAIKAVYNSLGENDKLSLYTFDTKTKEILSGDESKDDAVKKIDAIKASGQDTAFYDAAVALANAAKSSDADSCVAIIYTDGVETLNKSDKSKAVEALKSSSIPVYGLYPDVTAAADSKELNSILSQSGGGAEAFTVKNASDKLKAYSSKSDETIELTFTAASNIEANEKAVLSIDLGDGKAITYNTAVESYSVENQTTTKPAETGEGTTENAGTTVLSGDEDEGGLNITTIAIPVIAVLVIALILIAVLKKKKPAKDKKKADKAEEIETPAPITEAQETSEPEIEEEPVAEPEPQPEPEPEVEETSTSDEEIEEEKEPAESEQAEEKEEEPEAEEHEETEEERLAREEKERKMAEAEKARLAALESAREKAAARAATVARAAKEARASAEAKAALEAEEKAKLEAEEKAKAKAAKERAKKEKSAKKKMKEEGVQFYFVDK